MARPSVVTVVGVLAFLFAGSASFLVYNYLKKQSGKEAEGIAVVTAATDIAIGTKLDAGHLKLAVWPKGGIPAGCYTDAKTVPGRTAVRSISAGDIISEPKLLPLNGASGGGIMTYMVPQGHRAVTVAVNEVAGVAGFITPNSRVDILLTSALPGNNQEDNISKIILQNVPVLATGQVTEQKDGKPVLVPTVTLDLVPDDAEKLIVGTKKGSLQLLLRNVIDVAAVTTSGTTVAKLLGGGQPRVVAGSGRKSVATRKHPKTKPATVVAKYSVEVIKGGTKSTREFQLD